ncbi:EAL domain-containing protein [Salicola sp. Rm-C-2C1-2]|uniref:EAL domain-containing protein n=1 Tax=Salicola sp. Rm-C-2C1-2 TaxID=3141321 RepID=UPI0032E4F3CB
MKSDTSKELMALHERYRRQLPAYAEQLRCLWDGIQEAGVNGMAENLGALVTLAHRLAGSGTVYGFPDISEMASSVESACQTETGSPPSPSVVEEKLGALMAALDSHASVSSDEEPITGADDRPAEKLEHQKPTVLLVDDDTDFLSYLTNLLQRQGFSVQSLNAIENFAGLVAYHQPLAAIVDMDFLGERYAGAQHVMAWRESDGEPLPVLFISAYDSFEVRLAAVRAGGNHFLKKPLVESRLISLLYSELSIGPDHPYRVLLVDDDEDLLALYQQILAKAGYQVSSASDAKSALDLVQCEMPELALIDVNMPNCNGIELGQLIRQHEKLSDMAMLFMSAVSDTDVELACARLANDEFIHKPVEPWRLLMVVKSRVERTRRLQAHEPNRLGLEPGFSPNPLTALPMLGAFKQALDAQINLEVAENTLAILKIDIRDFHEVNELYGHFAGDQTLQRLAWDISRCLSRNDMLAHDGADEYLLMVPNLERGEEALELAEKIQSVITRPNRNSDGDLIPFTADIGIAVWPQDCSTSQKLLQCADTALFEARRSSASEIRYFSPSFQVEQQTRFALKQEIRQALADDDFVPAYQPIFSVETGQLLGFEALARWQHPEKGLLLPGAFIEAMEDQRLISQLTWKMLKAAIGKLAQWQSDGREWFISVNLSAQDIQNPNLPDQLAELLEAHGTEPGRLILEITESMLLEDWPLALQTITALERLGVELALDDFGTGYSSLNYLNRIKASKLKIDRSFIRSWALDGDDRLMRGIVQLSHSLGMGVVAEGVEERSELAMLSELECSSYQGFLASQPLLEEEFPAQQWFR